MMDELQELGNNQAFLKCSLFGFQGSGKTLTASKIAIGLAKYIKSTKPVYFLDTEVGSDCVSDLFLKELGRRPVGKKTNAFTELLRCIPIAERNCDIMIIDSITHFWIELCEAYRLKKYGCNKCNAGKMADGKECFKCGGTGVISDIITLRDWQPIKREWARFVNAMLNAKLHMIICGRAGNEYESQETLEGKKEMIRSGTKQKAEGEFGYEASLLIEMERTKVEKGIEISAFVWKDKYDVLNGKEIKSPKFEDFLPAIAKLNLGGTHIGVVAGSSLADLRTSRNSAEEQERTKQIALEEVQALINLRYPTSSVEDKKGKAEILKTVFGTHSWTAVEHMPLKVLEEAKSKLPALLAEQPKSEPKVKGA